ncbi:MAG: FkbM family methyltransferase [Roseburia sp.]|nr:FkbM family methyltransferase [Roseburia sp.]
MKKKILALKISSQYHVLEVFQQEIIEGFEAEGYLVETFEKKDDFTGNELISFPFSQYEFIFCINLILLDRVAPYLPASTIAVSLVVDHPIYHDFRFKRNKCLNLISFHVDTYRADFASQHYPYVRKHSFLPHGGSIGRREKPFTEREYGIVHMGSYESPDKIMKELVQQRREVKDFSLKVIETYLQQETISVNEAVCQVCEIFQLELTKEEISNYLSEFYLEDKFIRAYVRDLVVRVLLQSGLELHVFGNGWEDFKEENSYKLYIHDAVSYEESLEIMGNTRIILNVTPTLNNGSHERIFSAMLNGAICFTTRSLYLENVGLDQEVVEFSFNEIRELPQMVQLILASPQKAEVLAQQAQDAAQEKHLWMHRAKDIIDVVERCKEEWGFEKNEYVNFCEAEFEAWCEHVRGASEFLLFEEMKHNLFLHSDDASDYLASTLNFYNDYGFWGKCEPEKANYELFYNRIKEIKEHYEDIVWMFGKLQDYKSKCVLNSIIRYWLDYSPLHLEKIISETMYDQYFDLDLISCDENEIFVDVGGYHGETVINYVKNFGNYKKIICYEMFEENMNVCQDRLRTYHDIEFRQCAVGDISGGVYINVNNEVSVSSITSDSGARCHMITLDEDVKEKITFLKMDIEGNEYIALKGARNHIQKDRPKLAIACYHGNQDIWQLARLVQEIEKDYHFYLRYYGGCFYPSEYVLYGICP